MKTRILVILSLLVSIGAVLHAIAPPILFGMRPDMLLAMMFLGILLFPKPKYTLLLSIATGMMSALTTTMPGGEIANMIDKPISAFIFLGIFSLINNRINAHISASILTAIGTIVSGSIFLVITLFVVNLLDGGFLGMFAAVVLPASVVNTITMIVIYPLVQGVLKRLQFGTLT
ncbi:MAG TPA: tryptophan transporter [Bacillota bacterium]|nr:tryptophan transporter [Bacillota bacterium]